ncbi:MAG: zinc ribbon domain-containing protein [Planctomycetes bacterium]|nr:zinc ribbon domain-containing protein [Planctomycetota bacterium]
MPRSLLPLILASLIVFTAAASAAERKEIAAVDSNELGRETQRSVATGESLSFVWVVPQEFWSVALSKNGSVPAADRAAMTDALRPYMIVAVVRADVSPNAALLFHDEGAVKESVGVSYVNAAGETVPMQIARDVSPKAAQVVGLFKPMLRGTLGRLGESLHVFIYKDTDADGRRIASPYQPGRVRVALAPLGKDAGGVRDVEFPLDALFVPRKCEKCGREQHISWKFCPWDGAPLKE